MSFEPIVVDMEIEEIPEVVDMELAEEINVTVIQGTDVSDTTAVESDVKTGKVFYKASGDRAVGTFSESTEAPLKDVNFFDYDGTCLYSYTASEFAELSALPENPTHDGLTAQGWNWTLADAKAYVSAYGKHVIGQNYITSDGKTRIHVLLENPKLSFAVGLAINGTVQIDWGDGSQIDEVSGTSLSVVKYTSHVWTAATEFDIKIKVISGSAKIASATGVYQSCLFRSLSNNSNESLVFLGSVTEINIGENMLIGTHAFSYMRNLEKISLPTNLFTTDSSVFTNDSRLKFLTVPHGATQIGSNMFMTSGLRFVSIPNSVLSFSQNAFAQCNCLRRICLPTEMTSIGNSSFSADNAISNITIPHNVISIGSLAYQNCYGLGEIHFKPSAPPTVADSNAWTNLPTDCKIYVPTGKLSAYTGATNYPDSSTYTYVEE